MALTRKFLSALGIEADKIDEIITAHTESLEGIKADRDKYKADAEKIPDMQKEIDSLKATNSDGKQTYKEKYEAEHAEFEKYKTDQTAKETKAKKSEAYKNLLKEAGISEKHLNSVLKLSDVDSIEFDDDGKVKDSKKIIDSIKTDWSDMITTKGKEGAKVATPPGSEGGGKPNGSGRAKAIEEAYFAQRYGVQGNDGNGGKE